MYVTPNVRSGHSDHEYKLGLLLSSQLPVPMFLPEPTVTAMNEKLQPKQSDGNKGGDSQKDREETNGRDAQTQTGKN